MKSCKRDCTIKSVKMHVLAFAVRQRGDMLLAFMCGVMMNKVSDIPSAEKLHKQH